MFLYWFLLLCPAAALAQCNETEIRVCFDGQDTNKDERVTRTEADNYLNVRNPLKYWSNNEKKSTLFYAIIYIGYREFYSGTVLVFMSVYPPARLSVCLFLHLTVCRIICHSFTKLRVCVSACLFAFTYGSTFSDSIHWHIYLLVFVILHSSILGFNKLFM